jgi:8-oxo-dGTP pyrophosphatase MutT (NUDIX family)
VVHPRPSASVILVRDGPTGLESFMVRRHARSPVAPSAYVFPGGTVRADDTGLAAPDPAALAHTLSDRSDTPLEPPRAIEYYACAIRELFEEAGVLLARSPNGALVEVDAADQALQERLATTRLALQDRQLSLGEVLASWGWQPAFDWLIPFSHWVTPEIMAARFDTRFFVARMPARQEALHCTIETTEGVWLGPARVLDGDYHVVYATAAHLRRLAPFQSVQALLAFAASKPIRRVQPRVFESGSGLSVSLAPELVDAW